MSEEKYAENCRLCGSERLADVLDFGATALANSYVAKEDLGKAEYTAPLVVALCHGCGCVQLRHSVHGSRLFADYLYASSESGTLQQHFTAYAKAVYQKAGLSGESLVMDIGSNDGVLLAPFKELGASVLGVEPAANLCEISRARGCPVVNAFFTPEVARSLERKADLITSNNCLAHIDDLRGTVEAIHLALDEQGFFVFENAYWLASVRNKYFDQVYHEHVFYHSIRPLRKFLSSCGFTIVDVEQNEIQGGTIRVFCRKSGVCAEGPVVAQMIEEEERYGLYSESYYQAFAEDLKRLKTEIAGFVAEQRGMGKTFCGYGAPAKATLLCKFFGLDRQVMDYIVDDASAKQGRYMPGSHIPIVSRSHFVEHPTNFAILTAWNFSGAIRSKNTQYPGKWITPLPNLQVHD
jgi:SAM-dependent methyltransferase